MTVPPDGAETSNDCDGEGQQQITALLEGNTFGSRIEPKAFRI
jgi:hypothetical protein